MNSVYKDPRPIPASTASRSKLDAFRYENNNQTRTTLSPRKTSPKKASPQKGHTNKENQTSWLNGVVEQDESKSDNQQNPPKTSEPKAIKDCPQTPGNRLPLADLIGNAEDAFSRAPAGQELTPEDYVIWQHAPPSSNPSTQTPATQSRKRRHSSSPSSSPLAGSKGKRKESFDPQNFQGLLKTPQNDLATDLWNNYVAKTAANVPDLQQPRFANLLSSSPHTPASARNGQDSSVLRRSISCNAEWPSTKAKRRKVDGESHHKGRAIFSRTRSSLTVPKDLKAANFSSLVQEMERSLKKAAPKQPDPSKTVPIMVHNATRQARSPSPLETKVAKPPNWQANTGNEMKVAPTAPTNRKPLQDSSSDFGDDDLDDEFLGLADASDPFVEHTPMNNNSRPLNHGNKHALPALNAVQHPLSHGRNNIRAEANTEARPVSNDNDSDTIDNDEFDDDFEGLSDNIDELLAGCDQTASTKFSSAVQRQPSISERQPDKPPTLGPEWQDETKAQAIASSDEFDDDDFDIGCLDQPIPQDL
ncbi:hypothetical protein BDW74DRAFT_1272 [Aspergillus multicolor]|uniref:bifunctional ATP-dependent DNA helicase/ssDNA endodeoxyribonuclease DNA2 n=1 Tax=Aspergillus multicolor TaxID=41759 RepID=UPI003CCE40DE